MGIEIQIRSDHQLMTDLYASTKPTADRHPLWYQTSEPKYTLALGTIQKESGKVSTGVTSYDIPGLKTSDRVALDMKGASGQYAFSGVFTGTAVECSDFMIIMYAIASIGGLQAMQTSLYTLAYTVTDQDGVTRFPTYPTALMSNATGYSSSTLKTIKGIITDVQLSRDDSTPAANIVRWSFTLNEAAQL